jgi:L-2-hydroxyglutarate oxidase LhgO
MIPFMGQYRTIPQNKLPLKTLVYPVPHPINPFLGVHLTLTTDGFVKIGPTALPILGREQYSVLSGWSLSDIAESLSGARSIAAGKSHSILEILRSELPNLRLDGLKREGGKLVPQVSQIKNWSRKTPGIRAQLVHLPTGTLEQDFKIVSYKNSIHVLNAVSPGWTSAIPFGHYIVSQIQLPKGNMT